ICLMPHWTNIIRLKIEFFARLNRKLLNFYSYLKSLNGVALNLNNSTKRKKMGGGETYVKCPVFSQDLRHIFKVQGKTFSAYHILGSRENCFGMRGWIDEVLKSFSYRSR
ncbi:hypothetical protein AABB24_015898, partial [Solanum stoloniferum]